MSLINIGSTTAFNALISMVVAGYLLTYLIPISLLLYRRRTGPPIRKGPWHLGRWGPAINVIAVMYIVVCLVFSFFPAATPVTPMTMNWSSLVFGSDLLFSIAFYCFYAKDSYERPIVEMDDCAA